MRPSASQIGRAAKPEEIAGRDIDIRPDGLSVPPGKGMVKTGETLYVERYGAGRWPILSGGLGMLASHDPVKSVGSYWPMPRRYRCNSRARKGTKGGMMNPLQAKPLSRRALLGAMAAVPALLPAAAWAEAKSHRLALQISDNAADKMNAVLNVAANVSRYYADRGEEVTIEIVAFNAGMHMLRSDTSPVKERITNFRKSMTNVTFKACANTMAAMARNEGHQISLLPDIDVVEAGVTRLIELSEKGWTIVRP